MYLLKKLKKMWGFFSSPRNSKSTERDTWNKLSIFTNKRLLKVKYLIYTISIEFSNITRIIIRVIRTIILVSINGKNECTLI